MEGAYATFRSVILQNYIIRSPLKRNYSLNASKNIIVFQYVEADSVCPQLYIINARITIITKDPSPKRMLFTRLSFFTPPSVNAVLILHLSRYRILISGRMVNRVNFPIKYPRVGSIILPKSAVIR